MTPETDSTKLPTPQPSSMPSMPSSQPSRRKSKDPEHRSLLHRSSWPSPSRKDDRTFCREPRAQEPRAHSSGSRGPMPTNLNGLSAMLTGGGLKGHHRSSSVGSREPRGQSAQSIEPPEPRVPSGAR